VSHSPSTPFQTGWAESLRRVLPPDQETLSR
jgi:hypothetical protein